MRSSDALIAAILAHPDDDAPRLVWADREGGERGELVVVQCALAAEPPPPRAERDRLRARERELLAKLGPGFVFERGFAVQVPLRFEEALAGDELDAWPLLHTLCLPETEQHVTTRYPDTAQISRDVVAALERAPARITGLDVSPSIYLHDGDFVTPDPPYTEDLLRTLAASPRARGLRRLRVHATLDDARCLEPFTALEQLTIQCVLTASSLDSVLVPSLVDLEVVDLGDESVLALATATRPTNLRRLALPYARRVAQTTKEAIVASPALAKLEELVVDDADDAGWGAALEKVQPRTRPVRLRSSSRMIV